MILDEIKTKLEEIEPKVYYAKVDDEVREIVWDYIVFDRTSLKATGNRTGYSDFYNVHIVRENFIPDGLDESIIRKMLEISGMRLTADGGEYTYLMKPNTNIVIEMLTLHFVRARK